MHCLTNARPTTSRTHEWTMQASQPGGQQDSFAADQASVEQRQQTAAMSYSYGPTVVYPAFTMGEPFSSSSYEAKENYAALQGMHLSSVKETFAVYQESSCERSMAGTMHQATSTSTRVPLAERPQNSTSTTSLPAAKRASGPAPAPRKVVLWKDIDAESKDNPLACSEYAQQIFEYLNNAELVHRPNPDYVANVQFDMTPHMRCILVDWLVEVAQEYRLTSDTLHLTVDLLNRFLSLATVPREELQLAGIACMWIASKFEEIYAPTARNFCYITDNTYDQAQLVDMEARVLDRLEFRLALPTAKTFQRRYLQAAAADEELHYMAAFLLELTLMDEQLLHYLPSQLAAASVYLAASMLGRTAWDPTLAHYSRYSEAEAKEFAADLAFTHAQIKADGSFTAILEKYNNDSLRGVGSMPPFQALVRHSKRWQAYQQQQLATAASSSSADQSPIAGCFCSDMSSDMELV